MIETMLAVEPGSMVTLDASDALAVALCHIHRGVGGQQGTTKRGPAKNWAAFIRENPDRLR